MNADELRDIRWGSRTASEMTVDDLRLMVQQLEEARSWGLPDRSIDLGLYNREVADLIDFAAKLAGIVTRPSPDA